MAGSTPRHTRLRRASAVLVSLWAVFGVLLWAIVTHEPPGVTLHVYVPGVVIFLAVIIALAGSMRWPWVWTVAYQRTVPVPGWLWAAGVVVAVVAVGVSRIGPVSTGIAAMLTAATLGGTYVIAIVSDHERLTHIGRWPVWLAVVSSGLFLTVIGVGTIVEGASVLTVVFYLALLLFTFHVVFVLPFTLKQANSTEPAPPAELPAVDVLIPAYQEAGVVGECIEAVLALEYPEALIEVVVIDDGSTDGTHAEAAAYRDRGVRVLRRENGGKHAALNFGLQCTSNPVVVTVDADSRPEPDALKRMVAQVLADEDLGAVSANVLPANDRSVIGALQRLEYAVSNTNRRAYAAFGAVPVVPGCFGVYRREALESVWGFDPDTVTEDFDVTIKLLAAGWAVRHGVATVWTIAPGGWRRLWRQRLRWYRGGLETIRKHWGVLVRSEYGYVHALTLPARTVSQVFSPLASYVILVAVAWGLVAQPSAYLVALLGLFFVMTVLIGLYSVVLEDEPWWTLLAAPWLFVGYKHVIDASVGVGSVHALTRTDAEWTNVERSVGVGAE